MRQTAKPALAAYLLEGSYIKGSVETGEASFVESPEGRFSRVTLIGTIIDKRTENDGSTAAVLIDSTGEITLKAADVTSERALQEVNKGADALVIGKVRETRSRFVLVESIKTVDDLNWETVHLIKAAILKREKK